MLQVDGQRGDQQRAQPFPLVLLVDIDMEMRRIDVFEHGMAQQVQPGLHKTLQADGVRLWEIDPLEGFGVFLIIFGADDISHRVVVVVNGHKAVFRLLLDVVIAVHQQDILFGFLRRVLAIRVFQADLPHPFPVLFVIGSDRAHGDHLKNLFYTFFSKKSIRRGVFFQKI